MSISDEIDTLLLTINSFFSDINITFKIKQNYDRIHKETNYFLSSEKCRLYLSIYPKKYIYINNIQKCEPYTGTQLLQKIKDFGKSIDVQYIELFDAAGISSNTCDFFAFAPFDILTTGNSWYNKNGFINKTTEFEKETNKIISNLSLDTLLEIDTFVSIISSYLNEDEIFKLEKNILSLKKDSNLIKQEFKINFPDINTSNSIKNILLEIKQRFLNKNFTETLNPEQCETISSLSLFLDDIIVYEHTLRFYIGGTSKKKRRRYKTKKRRRYKTKKRRK